MKRCRVIILVMVLALAAAPNIYARFHGYGAPVFKLGLFDGKAGLLFGGKGGWINRSFFIGGGGYRTTFDIKTDLISPEGKPLYLALSYGGIELGYISKSAKQVHWTIGTMIGFGGALLREHKPKNSIETDNFFVFEPGIGIDISINKRFHLGLGVNYFLAAGLNLGEMTSKNISGPAAVISFKFGRL